MKRWILKYRPMRFLLVIFLLCQPHYGLLFANDSSNLDSLKVHLLEEKGRAFYKEAKYDSSYRNLEAAAKIYQKHKQWEKWYALLSKNASGFLHQGMYETALTYLQNHLENHLSEVGENDKVTAKIYGKIGIAYRKSGNNSKALGAYETALQIFHQLQLKDSFVARIYQNTANICTRLSDYDKAVQYFQRAIDLQTHLENHQRLYYLYCDLSNVYYYTQEAQKELECYQKTAVLPNISDEDKGILDQLLSSYHQAQGNKKQAMSYAQSALQKLLPAQNLSYIADAQIHIGQLYSQEKNWNAAQEYLEKAKQTAYQVHGQFHRETVKFHIGLGDNYLAQNNLAEALKEYHKGLTSLFPSLKESKDPSFNPPIEAFYVEPWIMTILQYKGDVFRKIYQQSRQKADLEKALECYELSLLQQKMLQYDYDSEASKLHINAQWHSDYEKALQTSLQLWETTQDSTYLKRAFSWAEKSKANLLIEQLQASNARYLDSFTIPKTYLEREQKLQKQAYIFEEKKLALKDNQLVKLYEDSIGMVRLQRDFLLDTLQNLYPNYQRFDHHFNISSIEELQKQLVGEELFIQYFMGDSTLYVFGVSFQKIFLEQVAKTESLLQKIQKFVGLLQNQNFNESDYQLFTESAFDLCQTLLQPILNQDEFTKLTVVPDGILHYLPFETLMDTKTTDPRINFYPEHHQYLIKSYEINYAQSATLWMQSLKHKPTSNPTKSLLAYAPIFDEKEVEERAVAMRSCTENALNQLKKSEMEVTNIHQIIGGDLYLRGEATKERFLASASQYRILHLATHACISQEGNHFNRIYFADNEAISTHDLYGMNLTQTDLAVLSACNTGRGNLVNGEGFMSLSRGFFSAGCPSVLMSLWSVPDESTAKIMTYFYESLHEGLSKSKALRHAKIRYLLENEDEKLYPLYWSAFVLVGNEKAVFEANEWGKYSVWGMVLMGLMGVLGVWFWCKDM